MVFFFKQKTAYEMRISDWSSDVCSSDLGHAGRGKSAASANWWARVRMPLGANVPRRRPAADASSLILPPRTFAPTFNLAPRPTSERRAARLFRHACDPTPGRIVRSLRSEEHTSELQSLLRISYAVFCLKQKKHRRPLLRC